jgi:uncharacterized protein (DUF885 family)
LLACHNGFAVQPHKIDFIARGELVIRLTHPMIFGFCVCIVASVNSTTYGQQSDKLDKIFSDYHLQYMTMFPLEATAFGDQRFNDQLTIDIAPEFAEKEKQFYSSILERLQAVDRSKETTANQLSAKVLEYELQTRMAGLDFNFDRIPFNQFEGLPLQFGQMGSGTGIHPFKSVKNYRDWLSRVDAFANWCQEAERRFREGMKDRYVLPRILVERMIKQMLDPTMVPEKIEESLFYGPITNMPKDFSEADRTQLKQLLEKAISQRIIPSYRRLGEFLRDEYLPATRSSSGISHLTGGSQQYQYWVRRWTTTNLTPEEIFELGEVEVARIRKAMESVKEEMKFTGSLPEFFDFLRNDPQFKPYKQPQEVIEAFAKIQSKIEPNLDAMFSTRPKTHFEIRRTEAFREKTASAEYQPGTADGSRPGIFYTPIPDATQFNVTSGMESLFLHEAIPGHHFQISLQQENEQLPEFARFLWYGAYGEGWALYCESIGSELGLYTDPKQKIGALGDEMHRAIRLVVDVGMHWKGWTREQALEYMMANQPISEDGAIAEMERYMAFTGQALSYKIGQLQITKLRQRCQQRLGSKFSVAGFHKQVLQNGCLPLLILEQQLDQWNGE